MTPPGPLLTSQYDDVTSYDVISDVTDKLTSSDVTEPNFWLQLVASSFFSPKWCYWLLQGGYILSK